MKRVPTRGKNARAAEAAAAAAEFAPRREASRRMIVATIATLDLNAERFERGGCPVSAERCRRRAADFRERLANGD